MEMEKDILACELEHVTETGPCPACGGPTVLDVHGHAWCPDKARKCWRKDQEVVRKKVASVPTSKHGGNCYCSACKRQRILARIISTR